MARRFTLLLAAACLATLPIASLAHADPTASEQLLAQNLFEDARRLMNDGKFGEACPKFAESQRLDPGGGTLLNLAVCHEKEGRLASASAELQAALTIANRDGRKDRQQLARERLAVVTPKLSTVTVTVAAGADIEGLDIKVDDSTITRAAWGTPIAVDPGAHRIEATAPARKRFTAFLTIDRAAQKERIEVPPLVAESGVQLSTGAAPAPVPLNAANPGPPGAAPPSAQPSIFTPSIGTTTDAPVTPYRTAVNPVFWTVAGISVAALGTSIVTGVMALSEKGTVEDKCFPERQYCSDLDGGSQSANAARNLAWVSTITLGVAVIGGFTLFFVPTRAKIPVTASAGAGSLKLQARW
jgi:hypothetical protein